LLHNHASRLIAITGPGGIDKTRLALEAAQQQAETGDFQTSSSIFHSVISKKTMTGRLLLCLR
jgi:hypothetical protein